MRQHVHAWHVLRVALSRAALCGLLCLVGPLATLTAQEPPDPDPEDYDYLLRPESATGSPGDEVVVEVGLATRVEGDQAVQGWSCGVEHDPSVLSLSSATSDGTDLAGLIMNGFQQTTLIERDGEMVGLIQAVILSLDENPVVVPISEFFSAARVTYDIADNACNGGGPVRTQIQFTDELGVTPDRPIDTVVTVRGMSVKPSSISGAEVEVMCIEDGEVDLELLFDEESATLPANQSDELACGIWLKNRADGAFEAQAWQYSLSFDPELLEFVDGEPGADSAALRGDNGPDFASYSVDQSEDGNITGVVVGVVIELGEPGTETLDVGADEMKHIDTIRFKSAISIPAEGESQMTTLQFVNEVIGGDSTPGQVKDPIEILFVQNEGGTEVGYGAAIEGSTKDIELTPGNLPRFIRSDANDDGRTDYTDAIWIINDLFYDGPDVACPAAADANDDGMVDLADALYIVQYQLQPGVSDGQLFPPPGAPFPNCGTDPDVDFDLCPEGGSACN